MTPSRAGAMRRRLLDLGFSRDEIAVLADAAALWDRVVALPEQHPSERQEAASAIHRLQDLVLARPGTRVLGWPRSPTTVDDDA